MPTDSQPLGKEFKTPGYGEKKAKAIEVAAEVAAKVIADASDEERVFSVLLSGRGIPDVETYREEPWHRHAATCYAMGMTPKQMAEQTNQKVGVIYKLIRRKEFQATVTALVESHGIVDIMSQFRNEVIASLATLTEIRDDEKAPKAVRANIAFGIIERVYGKAKQTVEHTGGLASGDPVAEVARLEAQNAQTREELFKSGPN